MGLFGMLSGKNKQPEKKKTVSHQQEWDSYFSNVDDILGSIMLDLGLKSVAPIADMPHIAWISVQMNNPREDGLSSNEESAILYKIEDALVGKLTSGHYCMYVGRLTSNNRRDLYFYLGESNGYEKSIAEAMSAFPGYTYDFGMKEDKDWDGYLNFLYPEPVQYQCMMNRRVLINLEKSGDDHSKPREVDHFLYFKTEAGRANFIAFAETKGFSVKNTDTKKEDGCKFMLHIVRVDPVDYNSINDCTIELWEAAPQYDGYYDGWGCPIAK